MGYEMYGENRVFCLSLARWSYLLELAYKHGWSPLGVAPGACPYTGEERTEFEAMDYVHNGFQVVTKPDASAMASALQRAFQDNESAMNGASHPFSSCDGDSGDATDLITCRGDGHVMITFELTDSVGTNHIGCECDSCFLDFLREGSFAIG